MDYFSLLGIARHPWLDAEKLKDTFHVLSARQHPDVHATGSASDFEQLNAAYQTLRDPVRRLRHLLELEAPEFLLPRNEVPPSLIKLFMENGRTRAALDAFRSKQAQATNALAQALLASEKNDVIAKSQKVLARMAEAGEGITFGLRELKVYTPADVSAAYQQLAFVSKWSLQLSEALRKVETLH